MTQAEDTGYISWTGISLGWSNEEQIKAFQEKCGADYPWSKEQKAKIAYAIGISRTQKYVTCTIVNTTSMTPEELAARDAEQEKVKQELGKALYYETKGAEKEMGL